MFNRKLDSIKSFLDKHSYLLEVAKFDENNISKSIPVNCDIRTFDFEMFMHRHTSICEEITKHKRKFDVILIDPPWNLTGAVVKRGIQLQYDTLKNEEISEFLKIRTLQTCGFLFVWVINQSIDFTLEWIENLNYIVVDKIDWIKISKKGHVQKTNGYYLMHAKETCLICVKHLSEPEQNNEFFYSPEVLMDKLKKNSEPRIFLKPRGIQSEKPKNIYEFIEKMFEVDKPENETLDIHAFYLEIFGRRHNLRNKWVTMGNQI